jgi:predicted ribonuclease YlaK
VVDCWKEHYFTDAQLDEFRKSGKVELEDQFELFMPNQGVILRNYNGASMLGVFDPVKQCVRKLVTKSVCGAKPANKDLELLFDHLWNPNIKVVCVDGVMGSGKTSTAIAFATQYALGRAATHQNGLIISRPNFEVGDGHGFLPGDLDDKLNPHMVAYYQWIERFNQESIMELKAEGKLRVQALAYIRGLDIDDSFLILDETQNARNKDVQTVLGRLTDRSRAMIIGDSSPNQIDVKGNTPEKNGLTFLKKSWAGKHEWFGWVNLNQCLRGKVAQAASQMKTN